MILGKTSKSNKCISNRDGQPPPPTPSLPRKLRCIRIFHALVYPHDPFPSLPCYSDKLSEIRNRGWVQVMHYDKITTAVDISLESLKLLFRRWRIGPEVVFDIDTPIDDVRVCKMHCKSLASSRTNHAVRGPEIARCI